VHGILWVCLRAQQVPQAALRVRLILLVLRVHCVDLFVDHVVAEGWGDEELSEDVQPFVQAIISDLIEVNCFLGGSVGVVCTAIAGQVL